MAWEISATAAFVGRLFAFQLLGIGCPPLSRSVGTQSVALQGPWRVAVRLAWDGIDQSAQIAPRLKAGEFGEDLS
jgi:hypothetical protein